MNVRYVLRRCVHGLLNSLFNLRKCDRGVFLKADGYNFFYARYVKKCLLFKKNHTHEQLKMLKKGQARNTSKNWF